MPDKDKPVREIRRKDASVNVDGLSDDIKNFYFELEDGLKEYYPEGGYELLVTSGKRTPSSGVGKSKNTSHHNHGNAFDLRTDEKVYNYLYNTPQGLTRLKKYSLGLLDETSEEMQKATGATGSHLHIGRDSKYVAMVNNRFEVAQSTPDKLEVIPMGSVSESGHDHEHDKPQSNTQPSIQTKYAESFQLNPYNLEKSIEDAFVADLGREITKQKTKEEKKEESDARKQIESQIELKEKQEQAFMESLVEEMQSRNKEVSKTKGREIEYKEEDFDEIEVQKSLPQLPSIFNI